MVWRRLFEDTTLAEAAALCSGAASRSRAPATPMIARTVPASEQAQAQAQARATSIGVADAVLRGPARAAPRHADQRPAGVHAGRLSLGVGRRRLVRHRGGVVRRPRGRSDPRDAPADRPAAPAGGQPGDPGRHGPAAGAGGPRRSTAASCWRARSYSGSETWGPETGSADAFGARGSRGASAMLAAMLTRRALDVGRRSGGGRRSRGRRLFDAAGPRWSR